MRGVRISLVVLCCMVPACTPVAMNPPPDDGPDAPVTPPTLSELSPVGRVLGFVYADALGNARVHPRPVVGEGLTPVPNAGVLIEGGVYARTDEDGLFTVGYAPEGSRRVRIWLCEDMVGDPRATVSVQVDRRRAACVSSEDEERTGPGVALGWVYQGQEGPLVSPCPRFGLRPLADAPVVVGGAKGRTDEVGRYLIPAVAPGSHSVGVDGVAVGAVTVYPGEAVCGVDGSPDEWAAAAGHAGLAYDAPEPYVSVEPSVQTVQALPGAHVALDTGQQAVADTRGAYTLYGVEPGLRTLIVTAPGHGGAARALIALPGVVTRGSEAPQGSIGRIEVAGAEGLGFVEVGETLPLVHRAYSPVGTRWDGFATFDWLVSDTTRAVIDRHGRVTGRAVGSVTITACAGGVEGRLDLLVEPKGFRDAATLDLSLDGPPILSVGSTRTVKARVRDGEGRELAGYPVELRCADRSIADVTRKGVLVALREGTTVLTAEALRTGGVSDDLELTVIPASDRLRVDPLELHFQGAGEGILRITDATGGAEGTMRWTVTSPESWLEVSPARGTGDGQALARVVPGDLSPGIYTALLEIDAGAHGERLVFVELTIQRLDLIIE